MPKPETKQNKAPSPYKTIRFSFLADTAKALEERFPGSLRRWGERSAFVDNAVRAKLGLPPREAAERRKWDKAQKAPQAVPSKPKRRGRPRKQT